MGLYKLSVYLAQFFLQLHGTQSESALFDNNIALRPVLQGPKLGVSITSALAAEEQNQPTSPSVDRMLVIRIIFSMFLVGQSRDPGT